MIQNKLKTVYYTYNQRLSGLYILLDGIMRMILLPYFEHEIKSSKTTSELKDLLNTYIQQKSAVLDELELTGNGKNRFVVHSNNFKFLEVNGTITEQGDYPKIRLKFGLRIFTIVFNVIVIGLLFLGLLTNEDSWILIIAIPTAAYLFNLVLFRTTAKKLKNRLSRILK